MNGVAIPQVDHACAVSARYQGRASSTKAAAVTRKNRRFSRPSSAFKPAGATAPASIHCLFIRKLDAPSRGVPGSRGESLRSARYAHSPCGDSTLCPDEASLAFCNRTPTDVNGDGFPDLLCHFDAEASAFLANDTQGVLKGRTRTGVRIRGTDPIRTVP